MSTAPVKSIEEITASAGVGLAHCTSLFFNALTQPPEPSEQVKARALSTNAQARSSAFTY